MYNRNSQQNYRSGRQSRQQQQQQGQRHGQKDRSGSSERDKRIMTAGSDISYGRYGEDYDYDAYEARHEDSGAGRRGYQQGLWDQDFDQQDNEQNYGNYGYGSSTNMSSEPTHQKGRSPSWYAQSQASFGAQKDPQGQYATSQSYGEQSYGSGYGSNEGGFGSSYGTGNRYGSGNKNPQYRRYDNQYGNDGGRMTGSDYRSTGGSTHFGGDFSNYGDEGGASTYGAGSSTYDSGRQGSGWGSSYGSQGGGYRGKGPKGYQRSDERIREEICDLLEDHAEIDASEIEVKVSQCEATLTGTVQDRRAKRIIEEALDNVRGLKDIHNQIRVASETSSGKGAQSGGSSFAKGSSTGSSASTTGGKQQDAHRTTSTASVS